MSSITWFGSELIQRVGDREEELGKVAWDKNSRTFVLWLKDTCNVLGAGDGHLRGEEFESLADAKANAASTTSVYIMHALWMRRSVKDQAIDELEKNWGVIYSDLDGDIKRQAVRNRVAEHVEKLPVEKLKEWSKAIAKGMIVGVLVELIRNLFGL